GLPFAASLLGILVTHEAGHYVAAALHRVERSLPYFIPVPLPGGIGTMGAVIRMSGSIPTRDALIDIGASGPLAGALVAVPVLIYGITLSRVTEMQVSPNFLFGNLSLLELARHLPTLYRHLFLNVPIPDMTSMEPQPLLYVLLKKLVFHIGPMQDVHVHPVAYAGVIGLFVTALNLVPIGQLDGGHVAFAVLGPNARKLGQAAAWVMLGMAVFSAAGWLIWWLLVTRLVRFGHPPVQRPEEPISAGRWIVVGATVLLLILTLTPVSMDVL